MCSLYGNEAGFEGGHVVPINQDQQRSDVILEMATELSLGDRALDVFEWLEEKGLLNEGKRNGSPDKFKEVFFDVVAQSLRIVTGAKTLMEAQCNLKRFYWRLDFPMIDAALNYETPVHWHLREGISKEMSFRLANQFGDAIRLPRRRDQRSEESRENMKQARLEK